MILWEIDKDFTLNKVYIEIIIYIVNLNGLDMLWLVGVASLPPQVLYYLMYDLAYCAVSANHNFYLLHFL